MWASSASGSISAPNSRGTRDERDDGGCEDWLAHAIDPTWTRANFQLPFG